MGLINCPECKNEVSDKAEKCPKCAYPINNPQNIKKEIIIKKPEKGWIRKTIHAGCFIFFIIIGIIILVALLGLAS